MEEFSEALFEEMEVSTEAEDIETLEGSRNKAEKLLLLLTRLRDFISTHKFKNIKEEIYFFKVIKPKFLSELIYARKMFQLLSNLPVGLKQDRNAYFIKKLLSIQKYIEINRDLLTYYRCNSPVLDEIYFTRKPADLWLSLTGGRLYRS